MPIGEIDRLLPGNGDFSAIAGFVQIMGGAVRSLQTERIPDKFRLLGSRNGGGKTNAVTLNAAGGHGEFLCDTGKFLMHHQRAADKACGSQGTAAERDLRSAGNGTVRFFTICAAGIKNKRFAHGLGLL